MSTLSVQVEEPEITGGGISNEEEEEPHQLAGTRTAEEEVVVEEGGEEDNQEQDDMAAAATTTATDVVKGQLHDLRLDMQRLQINGVTGNLLFWWIHPIKFVADPVFEVAENIVPVITEKVPFTDSVVGFGLDVTKTVAHTMYGVTASTGLVSSSLSSSSNGQPTNRCYYDEAAIRILTQLQSLKDQTDAIKDKFLKSLYAEAGKKMFLWGVHESVFRSFTTHRDELLTLMYQGYSALYNYANEQEILEEALDMGRLLYFENKALLGIIQQTDLDVRKKQRHDEMIMKNQIEMKQAILQDFPLGEAYRYMKFATAAYGDNAIKSAQIDNEHVFDCRLGDLTLTRVSEHTGIPPTDFVDFDVKYDGNVQQLRHYIALDRVHKKIILAIRGTYTYREVMIDFNGYSRDFLSGQAHAAISIMAERLWDQLSDRIVQLMDRHPDYELIVTGHSLGGGCCCLVNLLLHADPRMYGRHWRAFAFASPPVFVLSNAAAQQSLEQTQTCVNYINQFDGVPFLSGDTVRHQMAMISAIDKADLDLIQRGRILLGLDQPDPSLVQQIHDIQRNPLPITKGGCPRYMSVPARGNVWIVRNNHNNHNNDNDHHHHKRTAEESYKVVIADSLKMSETGIFIHKEDLADHLPARYEYVLQRVVV